MYITSSKEAPRTQVLPTFSVDDFGTEFQVVPSARCVFERSPIEQRIVALNTFEAVLKMGIREFE